MSEIDIEEIFAQLDPKLRKRVQHGSDVVITKQPVPSVGLNSALKGGLGYGRQVLIWGNKSSGKSSFCQQLVAEAQQDGKVCAWIDAEASFDPEWATRLGVDTEKLIYVASKTINEMVDDGVQFMKAGVDIVVVDSISALLPAIYFEKDSEELKQLENTKQIGAEARDMTNAVKMLNYANDNTLLIFISQQRNSLGSMFVSHIPTGGKAVQFFSSTIIKLWSSESEKKAISAKVEVGDKILEKDIGREVTWMIDFNKTGPAFISGAYDFYFDGDFVGIDYPAEVFDVGVAKGLIAKGGAWFTMPNGERLNGRPKAVEYLRNNHKELNDLAELCR